MPLPSKSYMDRQASRKEARSSTASPDSRVPAVSSAPEEMEKTRSTAVSTAFPSPKLVKDARTYDHERQRLKKAADFVKMRARKAKQGAGLGNAKVHDYPESKSGAVAPSEKERRLRGRDVEEDEIEGLDPSENCSKGVDLGVEAVYVDRPRYEVKLADLVQAGRPRKSKGDAEFEVIPHIRSVIVLDDGAPDEPDIDEPWEHIGTADCEDGKDLSYAQVVALPK